MLAALLGNPVLVDEREGFERIASLLAVPHPAVQQHLRGQQFDDESIRFDRGGIGDGLSYCKGPAGIAVIRG